ncbi:lysosomal alpha-glucosidase-like [Diorhabda sublineata]|uniref:lysosomal alpha-glucosidase-like n=1 Tax=Diorhabda sublineata TaxID=1163346 RepID=UPI0024E0FC1F|nr:lysosomal alpha-glucosidase-like [Diorhabda sublineata]
MDDDRTFIQQQNEVRRDFRNENVYSKKRVTVRSILCQVNVLGWLLICVFTITIPFLTYYLVIDLGTYKQVETYTCFVNGKFRVPCGKVNISESQCVNLGCCHDKPTQQCYHYLPSKYSYDLKGSAYVASRSFSPFNTKTVPKMTITIHENTTDRVNIILHQENNKMEENILHKKNYIVKMTKEKLMVEIFRPNGDLLLSTAKGPIIASENYWEWNVYLTNDHLFGIDRTLIKVKDNSTYTKIFYKNQNDHTSTPILWAYNKGKFHGLTVYHDGPLELTILPSHLILLKSLTGGSIELELTVGPTPKDLYNQQTQNRITDNQSLPYWALQTYMCRNQGTYWNVSDLVDKSSIEDIADMFCVDENLFMAMVLQVKHENYSGDALSELLDRYSDKKFLLSVPSQILENSTLYYKAKDLGILYNYNETTYKGKYLRQNVSFPDYSHENISKYIEYFDQFIEEHVNGSVDGFILSENWPKDEGFHMDNESLPYITKKFQDAMSYTLQWNATTNNTLHIKKHNNYGASQYEAFKSYYESKDPEKIIISATKSMDQYETTIIQNVEISWTNLRKYLLNLMFASITGNQLISLPVCGDTASFDQILQEKLCLRWYLVAVTMPLFRISSPFPYRGPADLATMYAQQSAADAVKLRNMLLPYFFSIIKKNEPLIRPMFYEFHENNDTFSMEEQYMVGDKILVAHPLTADKTKLSTFLPPKIGVWYEYWGGSVFETNYTNSYVSLTVRETDFLLFIAQGTIIPLKVDNIVDLIIAMDGKPLAEGAMQLDDISITFKANATGVEINIISQEAWNITLGYIKVYHYLNDTNSLPSRKDINTAIEEEYTFTPFIDPPTTEATTTEESETSPEN